MGYKCVSAICRSCEGTRIARVGVTRGSIAGFVLVCQDCQSRSRWAPNPKRLHGAAK